MNASIPGFWSPIEFSIPRSVSANLGGCVPFARKRRHGLRHERVERSRDLRRGESVEAAAGVQHGNRHDDLSTGPDTQSRSKCPPTSTTQP